MSEWLNKFFKLPLAATDTAAEIDSILWYIIFIVLIFFVLVIFLMVLFVVKYRRKKDDEEKTEDLSHNTRLEIFWTVIPLIILITVFFKSFNTYLNIRVAPADATEIFATAQKWFWQFEYPNGIKTTHRLVVPAGEAVKLTMKSTDVIHSFYVPDFRVKQDVLPNKYTTLWFEANEPGEHVLFCTEFCGGGHSDMVGVVQVKSPEEYKKWIEAGGIELDENAPAHVKGKIFFSARGCNACHTIDGSRLTGPTFKGAWGKTEQFTDGTTGTVDENYVRESILNPSAKIVTGYQNVMPSFVDQISEEEIRYIIEYMKTLK